MANIYYDSDANLDSLKCQTIAVIGYGSQGHAHALNAKDSGLDVVVGLRQGSASWQQAEAAGLKVTTVEEAARLGDRVMLLLPDEAMGRIYREQIKDQLEESNALRVAAGCNARL